MAVSDSIRSLLNHQGQKELRTCNPDTTLDVVLRTMLEHSIHHMPVISNNELVGIVSDRDVRMFCDSPFLSQEVEKSIENLKAHTVDKIMTTTCVTVDESAPVIEAVKLLRVGNVGALPVMKDQTKNVVGIVSRRDILDEFIRIVEP